MSRAGYDYDCTEWDLIRWRGAVKSALKGARGQAFLRELRDAMDAMEKKELAAGVFVDDNQCYCTLGVVGAKRGMDLDRMNVDPDDLDTGFVAAEFGIANAMAAEIMFINDEGSYVQETNEQRWLRVRKWVEQQINGQ